MSSRFAIHLAVVGVITLRIAATAHAGTNHTYIPNLPNTGGEAIGFGASTDLWWANSFDSAPGGEYLTRLDVGFGGGLPVGTPVSVLVYADPNQTNDPSDLQLLQQTTGTVASSGDTDLFAPQAFFIPPTYVSGDFFVAVEADNAPSSAFVTVDLDHPQGRSFLAANGAPDLGTMTPTNINSADIPPTQIESLVGATSPTFNFFIGARGRPTQYAEAQDPLVFDGFNTGDSNVTDSPGGTLVAAPDAVGGQRGTTFVSQGGGSVSVANGALTVTNGQTTVFYGSQYNGNGAFQSGFNTFMHANVDGYDLMQFHFLQTNTSVLIAIFGAATPTKYNIDANGNLDFNIAGQDWTDLNTFDFTIYSYNSTISLDSITLLTNPIPGDVNGDGLLNADDYALINHGLAANLSGHINGDLNGDGVVNAADYLIIDTAFGQAYGLSTGFIAERQDEFGSAYVAELEAALPEPAPLAAGGLIIPFLIRRPREATNPRA